MIALFSLCPVLDTGKFYFTEIMYNAESVDTFQGTVFVSPQKTIRMSVEYPERQLYTYRFDSIYMISPEDTQVIFKRGIGKIVFGGRDSLFIKKPFKGGCMVLPKDTSVNDTLFIYGTRYIDSLTFASENTKAKFYLRRGK